MIRTAGPLKVGIIGLCLIEESMRSPVIRERLELIDPLEATAKYLPEMKREGVDVIIALTHLNFATDRALAERFPEIDVIVGGHEHFPITAMSGRTLISKAGTEAKFVARIDVDKRDTAPLDRYFELVPVTSAIKDDPDAAAVIDDWEQRLSREMDVAVGIHGRRRSTRPRPASALGNECRQPVRRRYPRGVQADVAIVNSGGIRGNRVYPAGIVTRRTLIQMHPFSNVACKIEVSGRTLLQALNHGVARLPIASGQFLQVSGVRFHVVLSAPAGERVRDVTINGTPLDLEKTYTLALTDFMLQGGDGFEMFAPSRVLVAPEAGTLMVTAVEKIVTGHDVNPQVDGRITIEP